jgi:hypothetical protein
VPSDAGWALRSLLSITINCETLVARGHPVATPNLARPCISRLGTHRAKQVARMANTGSTNHESNKPAQHDPMQFGLIWRHLGIARAIGRPKPMTTICPWGAGQR